MKTVIFANGNINDYGFVNHQKNDFELVICADGGLRHADELGIVPNAIIGDLDSTTPILLKKYEEMGVSFVKFPPEKDFTDLELALDFAIDRGASEICIFGGMGERFDHTLINVNLLCKALKKGVKASILSEVNKITLIDHEIFLTGRIGDTISLIPLTTEVSGIVTDGLAYPLKGETLSIGQSRGVSNVFASNNISVRIESGILIIIVVEKS